MWGSPLTRSLVGRALNIAGGGGGGGRGGEGDPRARPESVGAAGPGRGYG